MDKINFNEAEILGALGRSGYLFESEISKMLSEKGFLLKQILLSKIQLQERVEKLI